MEANTIREQLNIIKFCIANRLKVLYSSAEYIPVALILRFNKEKWVYSVELQDCKFRASSVYVGIYDVEWATTK